MISLNDDNVSGDGCTNANDDIGQVGDGLRQHYTKTLRPFEEAHSFHTLHSPPLEVVIMTMRISFLQDDDDGDNLAG